MRKLTQRQKNLYNLVSLFPGETTASLCRMRGDNQIYNTDLRDRLFRLEDHGVVWHHTEQRGKHVKARYWYSAIIGLGHGYMVGKYRVAYGRYQGNGFCKVYKQESIHPNTIDLRGWSFVDTYPTINDAFESLGVYY
jgi:hypothetical protein